jgi:protein-tyrosine phosphatase
MPTRLIAVPGACNIRDLGGYATPSGLTQWRRILRADGLHRVPATELGMLRDLGVRTVIDLRWDHEVEAGPNPFCDDAEVRYLNISLLNKLALATVRVANTGAGAIADAEPGIVLFHCTNGKDRTGIIAALLLAVAGVDEIDIAEDYALTKAQIAPLLGNIIANAQARGENIEQYAPLLECEAGTMRAFLGHLDTAHGGVPAYLAKIGIDAKTTSKLRARLLEETAAPR